MEFVDLPIELQSDVNDPQYEYDFFAEAETRLKDLAADHNDITGAAITIEKPAEGRETPPLFEAKVVAYVRPNQVVGNEKAPDPMIALKEALDAVERQVREKRERLRNH